MTVVRSTLRLVPAALLLLLAHAPIAAASPVFPGTIKRNLGLQQPPPCTVCHQTLAGGTGTVTTAFGAAARARGLSGLNDIDKLAAVFTQLETDAVDSDGDGTPDIAALKAGKDPNPPKAAAVAKARPAQASDESASGEGSSMPLFAVGGALLLGVIVGAVVLLGRKKS